MENPDDRSSGQGEPAMRHDPLITRLRQEAMAERPSFSVTLHNQILNRVDGVSRGQNLHSRRLNPRFWQIAALAATVLTALSVTIHWHGRRPAILPSNPPKSELSQLPPTPPQTLQPTLQTEPILVGFMVNADTFFTKNLWPLEIIGHWPGERIPTEQQATESQVQSARFPSLPELLFALLKRPTSNATNVFVDIIPLQLKRLLGSDTDQNDAQ
jgi:hypothetical protein